MVYAFFFLFYDEVNFLAHIADPTPTPFEHLDALVVVLRPNRIRWTKMINRAWNRLKIMMKMNSFFLVITVFRSIDFVGKKVSDIYRKFGSVFKKKFKNIYNRYFL